MSYRYNLPGALSEDDLVNQFGQGLVLFDPAELFPGDIYSGFEFFCEWSYERSLAEPDTKKLLVADEIQMMANTAAFSWEQCLVVETGRKYGLDFACASQQPNLLHNRLRNQLTEIVCFKQEDALILDWLEEKGFVSDQVRALSEGEFVVRNFQNGANLSGKIDLTTGGGPTTLNQDPPGMPEHSDGDEQLENYQ